jgi:RHS repeat-associated protein
VITKGGTSVVPHQNWRGQFARGTFASGTRAGESSDCTEYPPTNGCLPISWPGWATTAWHDDAGTAPTTGYAHYWFGSQAIGMRDASGQMYMRNRYYDPATGQFTQPDPIGLAGGLNSYGFAAGDPVSYDDPYGLCPPVDECMQEIANWGARQDGALGKFALYGGASGAALAETLDVVSGVVLGLESKEIDGVTVHYASGPPIGPPLRAAANLPPKVIAQGNGVRVQHYYRSGDHGPAHAHVLGGGRETRIGQNGRPLRGDPELTSAQREVVQDNRSRIRRALGRVGRWLAQESN